MLVYWWGRAEVKINWVVQVIRIELVHLDVKIISAFLFLFLLLSKQLLFPLNRKLSRLKMYMLVDDVWAQGFTDESWIIGFRSLFAACQDPAFHSEACD